MYGIQNNTCSHDRIGEQQHVSTLQEDVVSCRKNMVPEMMYQGYRSEHLVHTTVAIVYRPNDGSRVGPDPLCLELL